MFKFRLVGQDGESVEPESFVSSVPDWRAGDQVFIRPGLAYRVVRVDGGGGDLYAILVVERQ